MLSEMVLDDENNNRSTAQLQSLNTGKEVALNIEAYWKDIGFTNVKIRLTGNLLDIILCINT